MTHENRDVTRASASDHDHPAVPDDHPTDNASTGSESETAEDVLALANQHFSRGRDADYDDDNDDDDAHVAEDAEEEAAAKPPKTSRRVIANWVIAKRLHDVLKPIREKRPFCLLIEVPEASWSEPIADAIGDLTGQLSLFRSMRDRIVTVDDVPRRSSNERLREKCLHPLVIPTRNDQNR
ncbi:hypothetical protein [Saliniramus fredricksonii]|uniref:Uncharacterized protein n=1 Tax=Saliniramus fredricksonii TaxID=1653334 RepID=A0ABY0K4J4_9HYPH|nr:hypothetical protein [Saliniramus fredricksonii]SCC78480.1 hypothetical protein GA0071312_0312 [Saliniramus fredricksonii]